MARAYPRPWFPIDQAFLTRGSIEELGEAHGAAGPLSLIALVAEANMAVGAGKRDNFDVVKWRYRDLGRRIRVDAEEAEAIVRSAERIGLVKIVGEDDGAFTVRLLRWQEWHGRNAGAANRKATERA
jgi:hypothetical protein